MGNDGHWNTNSNIGLDITKGEHQLQTNLSCVAQLSVRVFYPVQMSFTHRIISDGRVHGISIP